ncbi:Dynein heavy chain, outer arm, partial [Globisporangium splendens]
MTESIVAAAAAKSRGDEGARAGLAVARHRWIIQRLQMSLGFQDEAQVEELMKSNRNMEKLALFFHVDGPRKIFFYYQMRHADDDAEYSSGVGVQTGATERKKELFITDGLEEPLCARALYFVEIPKEKLDGSAVLLSIETVLSQLFVPMLTSREETEWGKADNESRNEFMHGLKSLVTDTQENLKAMNTGLDLRKPDKRYDPNDSRSLSRLSTDDGAVYHFVDLVQDWCKQTETYLEDNDQGRWESHDAGPDTELEYWKRRLQRLMGIAEQLKSKECKMVTGVLSVVLKVQDGGLDKLSIGSLLRQWKLIDTNITGASNEAKGNVKYLATLERLIEPLYTETPGTVVDALPALMNSVKMIHTIARYYSTTERMTKLFMKITNQMITLCKKSILDKDPPESIWDKNPESLLIDLEVCLKLNEAYQEQYRLTKDKLLTMPKGKQFAFSETQIFGKFDLFCRRVVKLIDMFSTIHQFRSLALHSLEGIDTLLASFNTIIHKLEANKHDLLGYHNNKFDRDYVEFNIQISDLEDIYEKYRHDPPIARNLPPVAGNILCSRHLLRRIEEPMRKFESNPTVLSTKDSKKIIKTYNKVARTLVAFEYLWYEAWCRLVETAKAGLHATLIIRHLETGKLYVNFDKEILQLIREAKCLDRMGTEVPENAKMVMLQEDKFKMYHNDLTYTLKEHDRVTSQIIPVTTALLKPHLEDLQQKLRPGMVTLTWTSMNIDAYKMNVHFGLQRLEELIDNVGVMRVSGVFAHGPILYARRFRPDTGKHVSNVAVLLSAKNAEIENAVEGVLRLLCEHTLDATPSASVVTLPVSPMNNALSPMATIPDEHGEMILLRGTLPIVFGELEKCQKSLEGYLEQKRKKFPRFYFVSNPLLLLILSRGPDPMAVQQCYEKIFGSIDQVVHDSKPNGDRRKILQFKSIVGSDEELITLTNPVSADGNIEEWLGMLEKEMRCTMKSICRHVAAECNTGSLRDFVSKFCGQFALLGSQLSWTAECQGALQKCRTAKGVMQQTAKKHGSMLSELSSRCLADLGTKMTQLCRLYKEKKIMDANDFEWLKQARFYWKTSPVHDNVGPDACLVSICDAEFKYSFEYLGCKERLVITPLTDRAYITLSQALGMHLGGAPAGPAGTGKTETVKDLGRSLGVYVIVTNCTDQQRYSDMAKIFKSLCQDGLWGCFDGFNRIELPVLSVVAQQVLSITNAKRLQTTSFSFPCDPQAIALNQDVTYFITMNPGYQGRQELPENLKTLFRGVSMMVPDREITVKVKLCSVGYDSFAELTRKFKTLYNVCEEQLSKQRHYDFGL